MTPTTPRGTTSTCALLRGKLTGLRRTASGLAAFSTTAAQPFTASSGPSASLKSPSAATLPSSSCVMARISSRRRSMSLAAAVSAATRPDRGVSRQRSCAPRARATFSLARSTSPASDRRATLLPPWPFVSCRVSLTRERIPWRGQPDKCAGSTPGLRACLAPADCTRLRGPCVTPLPFFFLASPSGRLCPSRASRAPRSTRTSACRPA